MEWTKELECGVPVIDYEHRELVERLNVLMHETTSMRAREMLDFLREYVVRHFAHEQVIHRSSGYPLAAEHKNAHKKFVGTFLALEKEFSEKDGGPEVRRKVLESVSDWLAEHIMREDRRFADYLALRRDRGDCGVSFD